MKMPTPEQVADMRRDVGAIVDATKQIVGADKSPAVVIAALVSAISNLSRETNDRTGALLIAADTLTAMAAINNMLGGSGCACGKCSPPPVAPKESN